jgi:hypothetical protein
MVNKTDSKVFAAMQTGKPLKSYIKTVPSKVYVTILSQFSNEPEGLILEGNPKTRDESCIVDVWEDKEDVFFKRANKKHLEQGVIIPFVRAEEVIITEEEEYNTMSDEEMVTLLKEPFFTLQSAVGKMTAQAPIYRMLTLAKEMEKSEKITKFIEGRLSALELEKL